MSKTRNNLTEIQNYIAEAIRAQMPDISATPGLGFAFAVNTILADALELDPPKSARDLMSELQKARWAGEREREAKVERRAEKRKERRRKAREAKKAEVAE